MSLVPPHGADRRLKPLLLQGEELDEERERARTLTPIPITSREASDLIMMGLGAFTPVDGFMGHDSWRGVCDDFQTEDGTFWPIPLTLSTTKETGAGLRPGQAVAVVDSDGGELMATLTVRETYEPDREHECREVFRTTDPAHPGVAAVMAEGEVNVAGAVKVCSEGLYARKYASLFKRPAETPRRVRGEGLEHGGGLTAP